MAVTVARTVVSACTMSAVLVLVDGWEDLVEPALDRPRHRELEGWHHLRANRTPSTKIKGPFGGVF